MRTSLVAAVMLALGGSACSDSPTDLAVVGEIVVRSLDTDEEGMLEGDGVVFSFGWTLDTSEMPAVTLESVDGGIVVTGVGMQHCMDGLGPDGEITRDGDLLTVTIDDPVARDCFNLPDPFGFRGTVSDLEAGSYTVRVIYRNVKPQEGVVFTGTISTE